MTTSPQIPRTSRPLELAGPGERLATSNTLEETSMFTAQSTPPLGRANHPSGAVGCDAAKFAAELNAVAESDRQLTALGDLFARAHNGAFGTVAEVGDAMRRIVGAA